MWETGFVFHISMPRLFRQDSLRCRRPVAQRRVRPLRVIFHPPPLRQNLCLLQRIKDLAVQKLIAQLPVETLTVPVLPRTPRLDVQRPRPHFSQPLPQLPGNELRPIVRTNVLRYPAHQHHIRQGIDHLQTPQASRHPQRQPPPRIRVDHPQDAQRSPIVRHRLHKIVAPHVIRPLWTQAHTRSIAQPLPPSRPLFLRHFQPFASPDPLHSILPHRPSRALQQHRDAPVAVPPILRGQGQDRLRQLIFVRAPQRQIALCSSPLPHHAARPPLIPSYSSRACSTAHRRRSGRRSFPPQYPSGSACPTTAATSRFSLPFSFSSSFSRFACPSSNRRIPSANGRTSAPRWRLLCRLVEWFFRWRCRLQSVAASSRFALACTLWMGMTRVASKWILSHSTWYKFRRSGQ